MYRQCLLKNGDSYRVSWIPIEKAVVGKHLKLKIDDIWVDGWQVIRKSQPHKSSEIEEREMDYKHQREASDV